ncbi:MAG: class I SAM-dependent methyltransferase [Acidobacteriota bacterium]|nr:class I SAM-dependent methyltransferase [Acidobacteriota bacterium]
MKQVIFSKNPVKFPWHDCANFRARRTRALGSGKFRDHTFEIWQCKECGVGFTEPIPTEATARFLYESRQSNDFQADSSDTMARVKFIAAQRDVRAFASGLSPTSILDFSCGDGMFTLALQKLFSSSRVCGSDLHDSPPLMLKSDQYLPQDQLRKDAWDLILCRHVLEHSYNPIAMLQMLRGLLREGGTLAIEVPALDCGATALFGKYWDGFYVPYHPIHFTRASLRRTMEASGFAVTREGNAEMPKMGRSIQNILNCSYNVGLFALGALLQPVQILASRISGVPTCLRIWGKKVS